MTSEPITTQAAPVRPPLSRIGTGLALVLRRGLLDQIDEGRLRATGLSTPYRAQTWLLQGVLVVSLLVIATAGWLRTALELDSGVLRLDSAPAVLIWLPLAIASLAVALVLTAALHAPWWGRLVAQLVTAVYVIDLTLKARTADPGATWVTWLVAALFVAQLGFLAARAFRPPAWWEPLVLWGVSVTVLVVTTSPALHPGIPGDGMLLFASWGSLVTVSAFVMPVVYASAIGAAQVTLGLAASVVTTSARRLGRPALLLVGAGLLLTGMVITTMTLVGSGHGPGALGGALAAVGVFAAGWAGLDLLARRRGAPAVRLTELEPVFSTALLVGLLVHLNLVVATFVRPVISSAQVAANLLNRPELATWADGLEQPLTAATNAIDSPAGRIPVLFGMLALALWWAAHRRRGPAQLLVGAAVILSPSAFKAGSQTTISELLPVVAAAALSSCFVVLAVRRRLTTPRLSALALGGLLVLAFHQVGTISSPLGLVFTGTGALIFGLLWGFLTGSGFANTGGRRWPRESRVMMVFAQYVLTAAMLVLTALFADPTRAFDTTARDALGAAVLGNALLACALATCVSQAIRNDSRT